MKFKKYKTYIEQAETVDTDEIWEEYKETMKNLTYEEIGNMIYDIEYFLINLLLDTKNIKLDNIEIQTIVNRLKDLCNFQHSIEKIASIKRIYDRDK